VFPIDDALAARGKPLFETNCGGCHAETRSKLVSGAWATSGYVVGTDAKVAKNAIDRKADPGIRQRRCQSLPVRDCVTPLTRPMFSPILWCSACSPE
jgi:hypothetical protein